MLLTRNALGNLLARYRAVLRHCRWKNALAALLLTGMVALPVENLWANDGGHEENIDGGKWYIGDKGASNNSVIFDDNSSGYDWAAGGHYRNTVYPGGKAENNVLRIKSTVERAVGGIVDASDGVASATNNKLLIEGGTVQREARGGLARSKGGSATATGNSLSIESNGKAGAAYGGHALVTNSGTATATSNALSIKDRGSVMGYAYGGYAEARSCTATGNALTIEGVGNVGWSAYGGYAGINSSGTATAKNNALSIKDSGSVGENAMAGFGNAYGGYASVGDGEGTAMGNTLTIEDGGSVKENAYGGYVHNFGSNSVITVTGNTVFLNGGSFGAGKRVYGGYAKVAGTGNVTDNTVVLGASLKANTLAAVELYGGYADAVTGKATVSNNTLEVWGHGLTAGAINNFENLYFILPASIKAGDTVLTVTGGAPTKFDTKANVGVAVAAGARPLNVGDKVTLLKNASGLQNTTGDQLVQGTDYQKVSLEGKTLKGGQGISLEYDFTLSNTDTTLDATVVDEPKPDPKPDPKPTPGGRIRAETKAVVEARAAAAAVLNGAGDLAAGNGIRNALAGFASPQGQSGMASGDATGIAAHVIPFAAVSGGWQRVETGSHANISGLAAMVGLAGQVQFAAANFLAGAFFEFGTSRMDIHNSFASGDVDGKGHASYTGGGILARLDVTESLLRGLYVEGTFRFGGLNSDWHTDDLRDAATGRRAQFDMYAPYIGGHAGLGYVWQATDSLKLDVYGKYLWTRLYGDDAMVALDRYEFDTVDSQRLRLGARLDWQFSESASVYVGAAWEHEFNGEARATTYGMETPAPTMEGDTGVFDLGLSFTPTPNLTVEAGLTGYAGMRQGIGGNVLVKYSF